MAKRILICDDDIREIGKLNELLTTYQERSGIHFDVTSCSAKAEITAALQDSSRFDILFLDIYMKQLNGLELARLVRKSNAESRIVFFSTSNAHALEAFGVQASQYLVKPVSYSDLANTMDVLLRQGKDEPFLTVSNGSQIVKVFLRDLVCSETQRHYLELTLSNGTGEKTRMNSAELYEQLKDRREFIRVGASFIVNLNYVVRISAEALELTTGRRIHVPRRAFAELKQKYFDYYCSEEAE